MAWCSRAKSTTEQKKCHQQALYFKETMKQIRRHMENRKSKEKMKQEAHRKGENGLQSTREDKQEFHPKFTSTEYFQALLPHGQDEEKTGRTPVY
jgi:hypothetical protein